jgi:N-acetylglucosamine-6-phosphate deacetylase
MENLSTKIAIKFGVLVNSHGTYKNGFLIVEDGIIKGISKENIAGYDILDFSNKFIFPGFIDIHTHGYYGIDSMDSNEEEIHRWARKLTENGVTSFIPTGVSSSFENAKQFLTKIENAIHNQKNNEAVILGARIEGPYISLEKKGAHNQNFVRDINMEEIRELCTDYNSVLKIIDVAPELKNFEAAFNVLTIAGIIVSAGHTNADFSTANDMLSKGIKLITHFYNAMSPLDHRNAGMVGAGFLSKNIYLELIADLHHVSPEAIKILIKQVGMERTILITDSLSIGGSDKSSGVLGGMDIDINNDVAWIHNTHTIAGSILRLNEALKNIHNIGFDIGSIIPAMGFNQANLLGYRDLGDIITGRRANICVMDNNYNVCCTLINGEIVYKNADSFY